MLQTVGAKLEQVFFPLIEATGETERTFPHVEFPQIARDFFAQHGWKTKKYEPPLFRARIPGIAFARPRHFRSTVLSTERDVQLYSEMHSYADFTLTPHSRISVRVFERFIVPSPAERKTAREVYRRLVASILRKLDQV